MAKQVKLSDIFDAVVKGAKRSDIKKDFELTGAQMKAIFSHQKLKGIRAPKSPIDIVDDLENTQINTSDEEIPAIEISENQISIFEKDPDVNQQILLTEESY